MKHVRLLQRAMRDLHDAHTPYSGKAPHVLQQFGVAVDKALLHLQKNSSTGSPRSGLLLGLTGLRSWPITKFPHVVFYFERPKDIAVVRVLHQAQDIPIHLGRKPNHQSKPL